ncbi:protein EMBRYO SAC DEVELOPMENT ARREST 30-like [Primulina eburnea]|uniref:protein EMBRYO SAC DEVELOPMENT ARREST 30-like n=1 Tax=Primulina eburnea TaxID=1245227 RepID=UPI003C6C1733
MGRRLYKMASSRTYRPDRKYLAELINSTRDNLYHPRFNWTLSIREHLNKSTAEDGIMREFLLSRPTSFLSHPIPECSCATLKNTEIVHSRKGSNLQILYQGQDEYPKGLDQGLNSIESQDDSADESEMPEDNMDLGPLESDQNSQPVTVLTSEQDEEMDPDD